MTVSAQNQVDGMMRFHLIEDVRRMGQQEGKATVGTRRDTPKVGSVERGIVNPDNSQLPHAC